MLLRGAGAKAPSIPGLSVWVGDSAPVCSTQGELGGTVCEGEFANTLTSDTCSFGVGDGVICDVDSFCFVSSGCVYCSGVGESSRLALMVTACGISYSNNFK